MVTVVLCVYDEGKAHHYLQTLDKAGVGVQLLNSQVSGVPKEALEGMGGLLMGGGPEVGPHDPGDGPLVEAYTASATMHLHRRILELALAQNMPILAIGEGMLLLNQASGGKAAQPVANHGLVIKDDRWHSSQHSIYLSPGSKLSAILGTGGFFKVNSRHKLGLKEGQRSPRLLASAYSLEDGVIEGLESPEHPWVVGVQWHPERQGEVSKAFGALFLAFAERAGDHGPRR